MCCEGVGNRAPRHDIAEQNSIIAIDWRAQARREREWLIRPQVDSAGTQQRCGDLMCAGGY
jgi:hypothetical protein